MTPETTNLRKALKYDPNDTTPCRINAYVILPKYVARKLSIKMLDNENTGKVIGQCVTDASINWDGTIL